MACCNNCQEGAPCCSEAGAVVPVPGSTIMEAIGGPTDWMGHCFEAHGSRCPPGYRRVHFAGAWRCCPPRLIRASLPFESGAGGPLAHGTSPPPGPGPPQSGPPTLVRAGRGFPIPGDDAQWAVLGLLAGGAIFLWFVAKEFAGGKG